MCQIIATFIFTIGHRYPLFVFHTLRKLLQLQFIINQTHPLLTISHNLMKNWLEQVGLVVVSPNMTV